MYQKWLNKYRLISFDVIDSTNLEAKRVAKTNHTEDFVIWSKSQLAGRGKDNRKWESGSCNLLLSILLNRDINIKQQPLLSFVTAIAVSQTLMQLAYGSSFNLDIKLKWPNDILINNQKIAGILLESFNINGVNPLIIGIGVNINNSPNNTDQLATSLVNEGLDTQDIRHVLDILMTNFDEYYELWQEQSFSAIREIWLSRAAKLNKEVIINDGRNYIKGIFRGIDDSGNIVIETADGKITTMLTGDVFFSARIMNKAAIILVAPQMGENIGAAARVMKNFGLNDLRIVNPRDGWPNEKARSMSVGAIDIVDKAKIYDYLKDALLDIEFLYATTAISRDMNKATIYSKQITSDYPYDLKVAIMFGRESSGLSNNEIAIANKIININTSDFSSLNIAQAIGIICYELFDNMNECIVNYDIATKNDFLLFCEHLEIELERKNFFRIAEKKPKMMQNIVNIFNRIDKLSESELQTLRGIIKSLSK